MSEHAPWTYENESDDVTDLFEIIAGNEVIAQAFDESTAKRIVTACNAHAEIVAALETAESALDNTMRSAGSSVAGFMATRRLVAKAHISARVALAKVGEK